jgi:hypothetical protein
MTTGVYLSKDVVEVCSRTVCASPIDVSQQNRLHGFGRAYLFRLVSNSAEGSALAMFGRNTQYARN